MSLLFQYLSSKDKLWHFKHVKWICIVKCSRIIVCIFSTCLDYSDNRMCQSVTHMTELFKIAKKLDYLILCSLNALSITNSNIQRSLASAREHAATDAFIYWTKGKVFQQVVVR